MRYVEKPKAIEPNKAYLKFIFNDIIEDPFEIWIKSSDMEIL